MNQSAAEVGRTAESVVSIGGFHRWFSSEVERKRKVEDALQRVLVAVGAPVLHHDLQVRSSIMVATEFLLDSRVAGSGTSVAVERLQNLLAGLIGDLRAEARNASVGLEEQKEVGRWVEIRSACESIGFVPNGGWWGGVEIPSRSQDAAEDFASSIAPQP